MTKEGKLEKLLTDEKIVEATDFYKEHREKLNGKSIAQFSWAKTGAILDISEAIHDVVDAYRKGKGVEPSRVAAFEWLVKAADKPDEGFYFDLAMAYYDGDGTDVNPGKFWRWMRAAVKVKDQDILEAMNKLADAHRNPLFGEFSEEDAFSWIEKAAIAGSPHAMIDVAQAHKYGKGVKRDAAQFLDWADKAASAALDKIPTKESSPSAGDWSDQDYPEALSTLAAAYLLKGDAPQAASTAKKAAVAAKVALIRVIKLNRKRQDGKQLSGRRLPEIMAEYLISYLEPDGTDAPTNQSGYLKWLKRIDAAIDQTVPGKEDDQDKLSQRLADVIFALALTYEKVPQKSQDEYHRFLEKAANAGHKEAMYRLAMKQNLSDEKEKLAFSAWITQAVAAGSNKAFIAKTLSECDLPATEFRESREMLECLLDEINAIRKDKHTVPPGALVAHYTDSAALESMLTFEPGVKKNLMWLFNVAYVNDPTEGQRLIRVAEESLGRANPLKEFFPEKKTGELIELQGKDFLIFVGSFSRISDRLDLWRAYGRDGAGFSIATPLSAFPRESDQPLMGGTWADRENALAGSPLYGVCYEEKEAIETLKRLSGPLDKILAQTKRPELEKAKDAIDRIVVTLVNELLYLYKDVAFENEQEVRMIVAKRFDDRSLRRQRRAAYERVYVETTGLFFEPTGSKIVIGPKVENRREVKISILHRLAQLGWRHCEVDYSNVPYQ